MRLVRTTERPSADSPRGIASLSYPDLSPGTPQGLDAFGLLLRWQRWLDVSGRCGANTRQQYRRMAMNFLGDISIDPTWLGHRDLLGITEDDLVDYLDRITPRGGSRNCYIRAFRSLFGWLAEHEDLTGVPLIARNPMRHITVRKVKYGAAPALSPADLKAVLKAAERIDPRARWAIALQYHTVCRVGSLLELKAEDIRMTPSGPMIDFREAKGEKPYSVTLSLKGHEAALKLLELLDWTPRTVSQRRDTLLGVGYGAYDRWLKQVELATGIALRSHLLRHTAITRLAEANTDTRTVMEFANWDDPRLLRRYAKESEPNMREAGEVL